MKDGKLTIPDLVSRSKKGKKEVKRFDVQKIFGEVKAAGDKDARYNRLLELIHGALNDDAVKWKSKEDKIRFLTALAGVHGVERTCTDEAIRAAEVLNMAKQVAKGELPPEEYAIAIALDSAAGDEPIDIKVTTATDANGKTFDVDVLPEEEAKKKKVEKPSEPEEAKTITVENPPETKESKSRFEFDGDFKEVEKSPTILEFDQKVSLARELRELKLYFKDQLTRFKTGLKDTESWHDERKKAKASRAFRSLSTWIEEIVMPSIDLTFLVAEKVANEQSVGKNASCHEQIIALKNVNFDDLVLPRDLLVDERVARRYAENVTKDLLAFYEDVDKMPGKNMKEKSASYRKGAVESGRYGYVFKKRERKPEPTSARSAYPVVVTASKKPVPVVVAAPAKPACPEPLTIRGEVIYSEKDPRFMSNGICTSIEMLRKLRIS